MNVSRRNRKPGRTEQVHHVINPLVSYAVTGVKKVCEKQKAGSEPA